MQHVFLLTILLMAGTTLSTASKISESQNADQIILSISQLVSQYLPASILPNIVAEVQNAASSAGQTNITQVLQDVVMGPTLPPYLMAIPSKYQTQLAGLESGMNSLRDSIMRSASAVVGSVSPSAMPATSSATMSSTNSAAISSMDSAAISSINPSAAGTSPVGITSSSTTMGVSEAMTSTNTPSSSTTPPPSKSANQNGNTPSIASASTIATSGPVGSYSNTMSSSPGSAAHTAASPSTTASQVSIGAAPHFNLRAVVAIAFLGIALAL